MRIAAAASRVERNSQLQGLFSGRKINNCVCEKSVCRMGQARLMRRKPEQKY